MNFLSGNFQGATTRTRAFFRTKSGRKLVRISKHLFNGALIGTIIYQIYTIGVIEVLNSLPLNPLFYLIFVIIFLTLPFSEYLIYRRFVPLKILESQRIFHIKRVYNKIFIGYSGEVYLYTWLKKRFKRTSKQVFEFVRDNNTISIIASWIVVAGLSGWLLITDETGLVSKIQDEIRLFQFLIFVLIVFFVILATLFRQKFYGLNFKDSSYIFSTHSFRTISLAVLQVLQWYVVIPLAGFKLLFNFVAIQMVIGKIPFVPNKDLIFISLSIYLAQFIELPLEQFTSLLIVNLILEKLFGLFALLLYQRSFNTT
jgi:hypothetical protein